MASISGSSWVSAATVVVFSTLTLFSVSICAYAGNSSRKDVNRPLPGEFVTSHDDACIDLNAAFWRTLDTPQFSYAIKAVNDGHLNPIREEVRVIDNALYLNRGVGGWRRHDLPGQLPATSQIAVFFICAQQSATRKEIHYSAWMRGPWIPVDVWVSTTTGKFVRTSRNYSPTGQMYHARTVVQLFNYDLSKAIIPEHFMPDIALPDIWAADANLR